MAQIHKKFTDNQVKEFMERYLNKNIERKYIQEILGISKTRFFALAKTYRNDPGKFSIQYIRKKQTRKIDDAIEKNIIKELKTDKKLIENKDVPLKRYNYSYIKHRLEEKYNQEVALSTIIDRAKKKDFYIKAKKSKKIHDREVLTNYTGELIQHDTSYHQWAPMTKEKWYLITSIDDYSRFILYAMLLKKELAWSHILALQSVILKHGLPYKYYVDSHSIFRFVRGRDELWYKHHKLTDESTPQWKQVLNDCNVKVTHALSPQAKGKIERPFGWLQDRLVRTCARENVSDIKHAQRILSYEIKRYNYKQIHSTTLEVPHFRLQRALKENSLFRQFEIKQPFESIKDIFCLRANRRIDAYRKISFNNLKIKLNNATPFENVNLRIYPNERTGLAEVRFWCNNKLIDVKNLKNNDLGVVHF